MWPPIFLQADTAERLETGGGEQREGGLSDEAWLFKPHCAADRVRALAAAARRDTGAAAGAGARAGGSSGASAAGAVPKRQQSTRVPDGASVFFAAVKGASAE